MLTLRTTRGSLIDLRVAEAEPMSALSGDLREPFHPLSCIELRQLLGIHGTILQP
jgi:hypothetical protein